MTVTYALVNQKGGVGKTTTIINLGSYLSLAGQRVLLVDLDSQANATSSLGVDYRTIEAGTYQAMLGQASPLDLVLHNKNLNLGLLPSSPALAGAQIELVSVPDRERRLLQALAAFKNHYDYILVDCPPSLGLLTLNGLLAATHGVIIPVQCEYLALEGLSQLTRTLRRVRRGLYPGLTIRGLLLTMYDSRTTLSRDVVNEVRQHFPNQAFKTIIPRTVRLAEAPSHGLPVSVYAPNSSGALAYQALAQELLASDNRRISGDSAQKEV